MQGLMKIARLPTLAILWSNPSRPIPVVCMSVLRLQVQSMYRPGDIDCR